MAQDSGHASYQTDANGNEFNAFSILHIQMHFTRNRSEWNEAWPQHPELHALLFVNSVWVLSYPTSFCVSSEGLWDRACGL